VPAPVGGLIERQPPRRSPLARRQQHIATVGERARYLMARRVLVARDLGVRCPALAALEQVRAEASAHALARRQLRVGLGERAPARLATEAALAPTSDTSHGQRSADRAPTMKRVRTIDSTPPPRPISRSITSTRRHRRRP
jgi:hypothetical protein